MSVLGGILMPHPPIIIEEVGHGREKESQNTIDGMRKAAALIGQLKPDTIVLITPHGPTFTDAITIFSDDQLQGDLSNFSAPEIEYKKKTDLDMVEEIVFSSHEKNIPIVKLDDELVQRFNLSRRLDHGALVPLHFVDEVYTDYELVCISYGFLDHEMLYRFGQLIQSSADYQSRNIVVIASGDLSHRLSNEGPYDYHPDGELFDRTLISYFADKKFVDIILMSGKLCDNAGECGKRSIDIMLGALDGYEKEVDIYSYEGPFGVGYGVVALTDPVKHKDHELLDAIQEAQKKAYEERLQNEDPYVRLARLAIESAVKNEMDTSVAKLLPELLPKEMLASRGGTFVSIKSSGGLRGCMGTTAGTQVNIAEEIIENAIKAATRDPRFPAIDEYELTNLEISVDVLGKAEPVEDIRELNPKKYGVIVTLGYKRGLLLPDLKGVDTIKDQIEIALNKAGIEADEAYTIEKFQVERHH